MNKMTLKNFHEQIYTPNVKQGRDFWNSGGVIYTTKESADEYDALVESAGSRYTVSIDFDGDEITETYCTCSNDWAEYCMHVIGVLFELQKNVVRTPKKKVVIDSVAKESIVATSPKKVAIIKRVAKEERMEAFQDLPEIDQKILKILAVGWGGLSQTKIVDTFNGCKFRLNGKNIYAKDLKPILYELQQKEFISIDRENQYTCPPSFADNLCGIYFSKDWDFREIANFFKSQNTRSYYYWNDKNANQELKVIDYQLVVIL